MWLQVSSGWLDWLKITLGAVQLQFFLLVRSHAYLQGEYPGRIELHGCALIPCFVAAIYDDS